MSGNNTQAYVYNVQKKNVNRAIELFQSKRVTKKRNRDVQQDEKDRKIALHCTTVQQNERKRQNPTIAFSKSLALLEMKSYLLRQDWNHLQRLFSVLLNYSNDIEPIVWRYALIIMLYSPNSTYSKFLEFLELCTGTQNLDENQIFEKLLSIQ